MTLGITVGRIWDGNSDGIAWQIQWTVWANGFNAWKGIQQQIQYL